MLIVSNSIDTAQPTNNETLLLLFSGQGYKVPERRSTYFPHVPQKDRVTVFPELVSVSSYFFRCSWPVIVTLDSSISRLLPKAEPAVLRQFWQWQR